MPDAISPEALPGWPYQDIKTEEDTLRDCLLGRHDEQPLTGVFGHRMLLWETLRHDDKLVELLTQLRTPPDSNDWKNDPGFSTMFPAERGFIVSTPGFPDTPFLSLKAEYQKELVELSTPGQPAFEIAKVEILDEMGVLEKFKNLATLARSRRKPGERRSEPAIAKRERGDPDKAVYDIGITIRPYMGIEAVREDFEQWLKDNPELFTEVDSITMRQWEDPRPILQDLAILRLTKLYGYPGVRNWTREHRPKKCLRPLQPNEWESYFGERGHPKGNQPIFRDPQQYVNAVQAALKALNVQIHRPT
jgi:hypothetical protein